MCSTLQNQSSICYTYTIYNGCKLYTLLSPWKKLPVYELQTVPQCPYQTDPCGKRCPSSVMHLQQNWKTKPLNTKNNLRKKKRFIGIGCIPFLASGSRPSSGDSNESWFSDKKESQQLPSTYLINVLLTTAMKSWTHLSARNKLNSRASSDLDSDNPSKLGS